MKRLTITYGGLELFDGDIADFQWSEDHLGGVSVTGRPPKEPAPTITDMFRASQQKKAYQAGTDALAKIDPHVYVDRQTEVSTNGQGV